MAAGVYVTGILPGGRVMVPAGGKLAWPEAL